MKRLIAILLAVLVMSFVFTACSRTAYYDDGMGYGNVSTTPNGYVNGVEGYNGRGDGMFGSDVGGRGNYGGSYRGRTDANGSGMTGGR